jgi:hypothetical protein
LSIAWEEPMLDRRSFTFGALLGLVSQSAAAASGPAIPEIAEPTGVSGRWLRPHYRVRRKGDELLVDLTLENTGPEAVDVLVEIGSRPGARVDVMLEDGVRLHEIVRVDRRAMISRVGPMPRYAPIAAGRTLAAGTFRFEWTADLTDVPIDLVAKVSLPGNVEVELPSERSHMGPQPGV